jgi:hypothetical protein
MFLAATCNTKWQKQNPTIAASGGWIWENHVSPIVQIDVSVQIKQHTKIKPDSSDIPVRTSGSPKIGSAINVEMIKPKPT